MKKTTPTKKIKTTRPKLLKGKIVSVKMKETATVEVVILKKHPLYKKRYRSFKKYLAHNKDNQYKLGDEVVIEETRPLSKKKRWLIKSKIKINK